MKNNLSKLFNRISLPIILGLFIMLFFVVGDGDWRGWRSEKPPLHLNPNMDFNASIKPQEDPLLPPENVQPWGNEQSFKFKSNRADFIKNDGVFYEGKNMDGTWVTRIPVQVNNQLMLRGQDRYNIFCTPCHGLDGAGQGAVTQRGWIIPAAYWDSRILNYRDGELFNIVSHGVRTMPGYAQQLTESDRWAIVAYVKALQKTHTARMSDVPEKMRNQIKE